MKFGVTIPNSWGIEDPRQVVAMGPLAETLGFDSVWVMDHLLNVSYVRARLEDRPYYHPLSVLSYLSATTHRVQLGTSVLVLPYHDPVGLAKYAATLDQLSGGRFVMGVGVGVIQEEFDALGIPIRRRGALTDESIQIMQALWTEPDPDLHVGRFHLTDLKFSPRPRQRPHLPLIVGGSSKAALRRAATVGNGWHPTAITAERYSLGRERVRELATAAGRDPDALEMSMRIDVVAGDGPDGDHARRGPFLDGDDVGSMVARLREYAEAGVEHVVLAINLSDVRTVARLMAVVSEEVIPAVG